MPTTTPTGLLEMNSSTRDVIVALLRNGPMARAGPASSGPGSPALTPMA